jgi:hypothetical protein
VPAIINIPPNRQDLQRERNKGIWLAALPFMKKTRTRQHLLAMTTASHDNHSVEAALFNLGLGAKLGACE